MKYCKKCNRKFETEKANCPICKAKLVEIGEDAIDEAETEEIVSTMTITGIL